MFPKGTADKDILVSLWELGSVSSVKERSYYLCNDHPAKMRPSLARAILQIYGESPVLDPMAGIGTTLVEAMLLGMDAIGIEYENRFVKQANRNIRHIRELFPDRMLGKAICIQGDARKLTLSLKGKRIKSILLSPPYWKAMKCQVNSRDRAMRKYLRSIRNAKRVGGQPISKTLAFASMGYGNSKGNIGNINKFGTILFSPPYYNALSKKSGKNNFAFKKKLPTYYSSNHENIGNLPEFGSIIFSPPLGESNKGSGIAKMGYEGKYGKDEGLRDRCDRPLSEDRNNIGNMGYSRTYLGEMYKVYSECYRVLKPGKFMVVVVKDIQRNWNTIPLGADTIKLCQLVGFKVHDIIINKLYNPSFWMLNLAKKSQKKFNKGTKRFHALKTMNMY